MDLSSWWLRQRRPWWTTAPPDNASSLASGTVVVGVDGTSSGQAALRVAGELAARRGLALLGVHVLRDLSFLSAVAPPVLACLPQWQLEVELEAFLDTAAAAALARVDFAFVTERGDVTSALMRRSRAVGAAFVVVGVDTRHRGWHRCPARRLAACADVPLLVAGSGTGEGRVP